MLPLYQCCLLPDFQPLRVAVPSRIVNPPKGGRTMPKRGGERNRRAPAVVDIQAVAGTRRVRSHTVAETTAISSGTAARFTAAQPTA